MSESPVDSETNLRSPNRLPAEWEAQRSVWLAWPHNQETWEPVLEEAEAQFLKMMGCLTDQVIVQLLLPDEESYRSLRPRLALLPVASNIRCHVHPTNDSWVRDYGPITVRNGADGALTCLDFRFNAWGAKYPRWEGDDEAGSKIAQWEKIPMQRMDWVLEGGAIDSNGEGLVLCNRDCVTKGRNAHLSFGEIDRIMLRVFGLRDILWCDGALSGDDTDGHIDTFFRFVGPKTVLATVADPSDTENHRFLSRNLEKLTKFSEKWGLEIRTIPLPAPFEVSGIRVPATYINFLICNQVVLVPIFGKKTDQQALAIFSNLFPSHRIRAVDCRALIYGLGAIHCLTMQIPQ